MRTIYSQLIKVKYKEFSKWPSVTIRKDKWTRPIWRACSEWTRILSQKARSCASPTLKTLKKLTIQLLIWGMPKTSQLFITNQNQPLSDPLKIWTSFTDKRWKCFRSMDLKPMKRTGWEKFSNLRKWSYSRNKLIILTPMTQYKIRSILTGPNAKKRAVKWQNWGNVLLWFKHVLRKEVPKRYQGNPWARTNIPWVKERSCWVLSWWPKRLENASFWKDWFWGEISKN